MAVKHHAVGFGEGIIFGISVGLPLGVEMLGHLSEVFTEGLGFFLLSGLILNESLPVCCSSLDRLPQARGGPGEWHKEARSQMPTLRRAVHSWALEINPDCWLYRRASVL